MRDSEQSVTARVAYAALAWVVVFFAFHVYWYLGGSFGRSGELPGAPDSAGGWVFLVLVVSAFPLGVWVCLAIARGWARHRMRRLAATVAFLACVLLVLRGGSGVIDELTRVTGLLPDGITGLSREEAMGTAHPSAHELWSSRATDAYFLAGGLLFGLLAYRHVRSTNPTERERSSQGSEPGDPPTTTCSPPADALTARAVRARPTNPSHSQ